MKFPLIPSVEFFSLYHNVQLIINHIMMILPMAKSMHFFVLKCFYTYTLRKFSICEHYFVRRWHILLYRFLIIVVILWTLQWFWDVFLVCDVNSFCLMHALYFYIQTVFEYCIKSSNLNYGNGNVIPLLQTQMF